MEVKEPLMYMTATSASKVEVQLLKILSKYKANEAVVINICRCLFGLRRNSIEKSQLVESMKKLNLYPTLIDILKSLGLQSKSFVKDEVVAMYITLLLEDFFKDDKNENSAGGVVTALYLIAPRFCETSASTTSSIFQLIIALCFNVDMIKRVIDTGFIELLCSYYFKFRYQVCLPIASLFNKLCRDLLDDSKKQSELTRSKYIEVYDLSKRKFIDSDIIQVFYDMRNIKNLDRMIETGMEEMEIWEICDSLVNTGLLDNSIYGMCCVNDDGVAIYEDYDEDNEISKYYYVDESSEKGYLDTHTEMLKFYISCLLYTSDAADE